MSFKKDIARSRSAGKKAEPGTKRLPCSQCRVRARECFRPFSPPELAFMESFKTGELLVDVGATILAEGSNSAHFYTVLSGWVFRYKLLTDGRRQILNYGLPGDLLGLQGAVADAMQHSVDALTPVRLCVFERDALWTLYSQFPSLSFDVTWLASREERLLDEQLLTVGQRKAEEKVAFVLLRLFRRAQHVELTDGQRLELPLTQQHLADTLGFSLVHTNKTLKRLESRRLFRWRGKILTMLDAEALAELAQYGDDTSARRPIL